MNEKWVKRLGLWSVLLLCLTGTSASGQTLTLNDCVRLAIEAPSAARTAELEASIAAERQTAARAELLPQLGLTSSYTYNSPVTNGPNSFSFVALNGVREYLATADTSWSVDLSGRLRAGLALARAGREIASADLAIARRDVRRAVMLAFYDVLLARRIAELEEGSLEEAREFERMVRARREQGEASQADVLKASAQRAQFEQRVAQAQLDARLANQILASFWTTDVDRELSLAEALDSSAEPTPTAVGERSEPEIQHRPELRRLDALSRSPTMPSERLPEPV